MESAFAPLLADRRTAQKPENSCEEECYPTPSDLSVGPAQKHISVISPAALAIDAANALLESAYDFSAEWSRRLTSVSRALTISKSVSLRFADPMFPFRPHSSEIQSAKRALLMSHSTMVHLLCQHNFLQHRELIHEHLRDIVRLQGHQLLSHEDKTMFAAFHSFKVAIGNSNWPVSRRIKEWALVASNVPLDEYFAGLRYWTYVSILKMEITEVEKCLEGGDLEETKNALDVIQDITSSFLPCMKLISSAEDLNTLPDCRDWNEPQYYCEKADELFGRVQDVRWGLSVRLLLRQGDTILELATDRSKRVDEEYFKFQAIMALDSYRSAYIKCSCRHGFQVGLEAFCLFSMGRLMGNYLGLEEHAYNLFQQAVELMQHNPPESKWYSDAVAWIQSYQMRMAEEEKESQSPVRTEVMEILSMELMELQSRAQMVSDEGTLRQFFDWLLRTHNPRHDEQDSVSGVLESRELSKVTLNVIGVYKSATDSCETLWQVLSGEIVKVGANNFAKLI
jgi:hypothetical protein